MFIMKLIFVKNNIGNQALGNEENDEAGYIVEVVIVLVRYKLKEIKRDIIFLNIWNFVKKKNSNIGWDLESIYQEGDGNKSFMKDNKINWRKV